jgi:hypothetical protein
MRVFTPQRRHRTALVALVAVTLAVVAAVSVAWMTGSDSSAPRPGVVAPAPTATTTDPRGAVTDAGVNPWAFNDPATVVRFLEERCPDAPPPARVDQLLSALQACLASTPPNTESTQKNPIDVSSLWQTLAAIPAADRDNLVAGLAPNVRADLARIAEVAAAAAVIR